jgi:hypothetical protein
MSAQLRVAGALAAVGTLSCTGAGEPAAWPLTQNDAGTHAISVQPKDAPTTAGSSAPTDGGASAPSGSWLAAADSTAWPFPRQDRCLSETGCPFRPTPIPSCGSRPEFVSVDRALELAASAPGSAVVVRGELRALAHSTLLVCIPGCCNRTHADFELVASGPNGSGRAIRLVERTLPDAFHCSGDDSKLCCGIEAPSRFVLVWGHLAVNSESGKTELRSPTICGLPDLDADSGTG